MARRRLVGRGKHAQNLVPRPRPVIEPKEQVKESGPSLTPLNGTRVNRSKRRRLVSLEPTTFAGIVGVSQLPTNHGSPKETVPAEAGAKVEMPTFEAHTDSDAETEQIAETDGVGAPQAANSQPLEHDDHPDSDVSGLGGPPAILGGLPLLAGIAAAGLAVIGGAMLMASGSEVNEGGASSIELSSAADGPTRERTTGPAAPGSAAE